MCCSLCFQPHLLLRLRDMKGKQGFPSYMSFVLFWNFYWKSCGLAERWGRSRCWTQRLCSATLPAKAKVSGGGWQPDRWWSGLGRWGGRLETGWEYERWSSASGLVVSHQFFPRFLVLIFKVNFCESHPLDQIRDRSRPRSQETPSGAFFLRPTPS